MQSKLGYKGFLQIAPIALLEAGHLITEQPDAYGPDSGLHRIIHFEPFALDTARLSIFKQAGNQSVDSGC